MTLQDIELGNEDQALFTPAQAARRLGVSEIALRSWIFRDRIGVRRIGRRVFIPRDELARLAERPGAPSACPARRPRRRREADPDRERQGSHAPQNGGAGRGEQ